MNRKGSLKQSIAMLVAVTLLTTGVTTYAAMTREKEISFTQDNAQQTVSTKVATVGALLEENGYRQSKRTQTNLPLDAEITDSMEVVVQTRNTVHLSLFGKEAQIDTDQKTVKEFLAAQGIEISENDILSPATDTKIHDGISIAIDRLTETVAEEEINTPFESITQETDELYEGETRIAQEGIDGVHVIRTKTTKHNGQMLPVKTEEIVMQEVQNEIVEVGTAVYVEEPVYTESASESHYEESSYSSSGDWMTFKATAYDPSVGDTTRMGTPARLGVIAVDPSVIPLGSIVEVEGYGTFSAEDTGGAINGNIIDIFVSSYEEAINFGVRTVRVRIVQ